MSGKTVEIMSGRALRRRWSVGDKLRIVAATYEPGACVRQVAASHEVYAGLLFAWRRQVAMAGLRGLRRRCERHAARL